MHIIKYADDTAIIGLIEGDNVEDYFQSIEFVELWCRDNFLDLNVQKTKEMSFDFRRKIVEKQHVSINSKTVEIVSEYKYLLIDCRLSFKNHVTQQVKKVQKRLFFARYLRKLNVECELIMLFVNATVPAVLLYACPVFYGMLPAVTRKLLDKPMKVCQRLCGGDLMSNLSTYEKKTLGLAKKICQDNEHPLYHMFEMLPSGRRLRVPMARTSRYKGSFVLEAVSLMNKFNQVI
jgi:hypothetical protein